MNEGAGGAMSLGDIVVGVFVAVLGLLGLVLAGGALSQDDGPSWRE